MGYKLVEIELSRPVEAIALGKECSGVGLIARWHDQLVGFQMIKLPGRDRLEAAEVEAIADERFAAALLTAKAMAELPARAAPPLPTLSVAICTKDRAVRVARLLTALVDCAVHSRFAATEILVIDNASVDDATKKAATQFPGVRYVSEPKAGLNFARNAALANATGSLLAFLDDDVVIDRHWFDGLAEAWRGAPGAAGFTGLVLPFRLDTDAQVCFEEHGGFGRGFERREFAATSLVYPLHPVGAGLLGAGCNMAFDRALLNGIGGFDDALDTGAPLPGGGDLDIFYRVLRSGRPMIYEPRYAVFHEHRETIAQLRRQYWTWGLGMMAFLVKISRSDPSNRATQRALTRWWLLNQVKSVAGAAARMRLRDLRFRLAELRGGIQGLFGEYDRSTRRSTAIRERRA